MAKKTAEVSEDFGSLRAHGDTTGDRAVALLHGAIHKGFQGLERLKNDQQMAPLRTHEGFRKPLSELEEKAKPGAP